MYSRRLINLRLSHSDYFNNVFHNVLGQPLSIPQEAYGLVCRSDPALRFNQTYLKLCSEDE